MNPGGFGACAGVVSFGCAEGIRERSDSRSGAGLPLSIGERKAAGDAAR
jgi:hypothetical protein